MSYERLISEHGRIDMALGRLQLLIEADEPDAAAVTIGLSDLSSELTAHLHYEDNAVYPRMIASTDEHTSATARQFAEDFAQLREDWSLYLSEWNRDCILADWAEFRRYTRTMIARLSERIRAENEQLYTAALQASAIRLRRAA
jgi:iron-sulfur cluster repair protein YtfE (RIC family)